MQSVEKNRREIRNFCIKLLASIYYESMMQKKRGVKAIETEDIHDRVAKTNT